ncbi:MAG: 50S ribosomal protein L18e [Candidatus Hadarchaeales archaeon]
MRPTGPTNPVLRGLIRRLREEGRRRKAGVWLELAERLSGPRRSRAEVNLSHLNRCAGEGETVVVPGKVLAAGRLTKPLRVAAFGFSGTARRKILSAGGEVLSLAQLLEQNPEGKNLRIVE